MTRTFTDNVRRARNALVYLNDHEDQLGAAARSQLETVLDMWDMFEYAAGTGEGGPCEVLS